MYSLLPFWFLGGLLTVVALFCVVALLSKSKRQWLLLRIFPVCIVYTVLFWGVIGTTTDVERDYVFNARWRHTASAEPGTSNLVTLEYLDYPDCFERVNSPAVYQHLISKNSELATITVRVAYDFGSVRGYGLEKVDDLPANQTWAGGNTPWQIFGRRSFASRWFKFLG